MKSLCITGADPVQIEALAELLRQSGMEAAKPVHRDGSIDFSTWHQQVIASAHEESPEWQAVEHPGRLWEQLAGELFLANMKSKLWGWADRHSIWLLDFWAAFEPRLNFVLVSTSPERLLATEIAAGQAESDIDRLIADWQAWHTELLRFYHRHPKRCLLVDAEDALAHPREFVSHCNAHWKTALHPELAVSAASTQDLLAIHIAKAVCRDYPQTAGLQGELTATIVPFGQVGQANAIQPDSLVTAYRQLHDNIDRLQQAKEQTAADLHITQEKLAAVRQENKRLMADNTEAANRVTTQELDAAQAKLNEAEQENELLLLQLHQVQEELEHYFLQHQDIQHKLKETEARWQRMLQNHPDYLDYAGIEATRTQDGIRWRISDLEAAGRTLPQLEFVTDIEQDCLVYRINRTHYPFVRWPLASVDQLLEITLVGNESNKIQRVESLLNLAASDWNLLQALNRLLSQVIANPARLKTAGELPLAETAAALETLEGLMAKLPALLRYDTANLKREQVNNDYEHLWIRLDNLSLGTLHWPHFEFRISCANVRPQKFGTHPKLEFPAESGQAPFEAWFEESTDDFGAKLELRFALPNAMDGAVWQQLAERDRTLIKQLLNRLPSILANLKQSGTQIKRPWQDWTTMAREAERILTDQTQ